MKIKIENLADDCTEDALRSALEPFGTVASVAITKDKNDGKATCYGIAEMASTEEGKAAMDGLSGSTLNGNTLTVAEAKSECAEPVLRPGQRGYDGNSGGYGGGKSGFAAAKGNFKNFRGGYAGGRGRNTGGRGAQGRGR